MSKSKLQVRSILALATGITLAPSLALAVQTWTDATGDYAGGSATAPPPGDSYQDIASVVVTNNATNMFFQINLAASDGGHATNITTDTTQSYGKYQIGLETVPGAGLVSTPSTVSNPYNPIGISTGINYWLDNWTNQTTGGTVATPDTGDGQVFNYSGGAWTQVGGNGLATDVPGNAAFTQTTLGTTSVTMTVSLAALGLSVGNHFNFDVWTTYDGGAGAVDALDSGAAATSESSPTYINPYSGSPTNAYDSATAPGSTYSTTIYTVSTPTFTWNNTPASAGGDGITWDKTSYNWNNGVFADLYTDGSNVILNDNNSGPASYAVTLSSTVTPASVTVNNSLGNYTISGNGSIAGAGSLTKSGTGTLVLATANSYSGGTTVTAGTLQILRTSATTSALPKGALAISGTGVVQLGTNVTLGSQSANPGAGGTAPTSNVNITSLSITGGNATLDITNNHIIIDYTPGNDPIASIEALINQGADVVGGTATWAGAGITSTTAAANAKSYGIGYADAKDPGNPAGLAVGQIEIAYTLLGDANLDGKVNGTDFNILAANFNTGGASWDQGDFSYDGKVNGTDFNMLAANFNQGATQSADEAAVAAFMAGNGLTATSVPEPASFGLVTVLAAGLLKRRARRG